MSEEAPASWKATYPAEALEPQGGHPPEPDRWLDVIGGGGGGKEPFPDDIDETTQGHPPEPHYHRDLVNETGEEALSADTGD
jgi:hypothetical protein